MEQKYRVNELAKDLNVSTGEITELVQEYFGVQKKAQASLSEEEIYEWEREHRALLALTAPEEFDVLHYAAISILRKK